MEFRKGHAREPETVTRVHEIANQNGTPTQVRSSILLPGSSSCVGQPPAPNCPNLNLVARAHPNGLPSTRGRGPVGCDAYDRSGKWLPTHRSHERSSAKREDSTVCSRQPIAVAVRG